jgi:hypothetical protein
VESEYILMEEAKGKKLSKIWYDLDLFAKLRIVDEVVAIEKKLLPISFTRSVRFIVTWGKTPQANQHRSDMEASTSIQTCSQVAKRSSWWAMYHSH